MPIGLLPPARLAVRIAALVAGGTILAACGGAPKSAQTAEPQAKSRPVQSNAVATGAPALQTRFENVVDAVSPAVVEIRTGTGLGSGIVFDRRGDVVTNAHVVAGSRTFRVRLSDGRRRSARLVGVAPDDDLAVVRLSSGSPAPARFADSAQVRVGDLALAIGNPLGLASSVTEGIVSSTGRRVSEGNGVTLESTIQTSAAINPGNSGGALVDLDGRVIGIPTLAAIDPELGDTAAPGIGFAIASNQVTAVAKQIIASSGAQIVGTAPAPGRK
jgi:putative serine protease PepD